MRTCPRTSWDTAFEGCNRSGLEAVACNLEYVSADVSGRGHSMDALQGAFFLASSTPQAHTSMCTYVAPEK